MLPIPLYAAGPSTDVAATSALVQGINDNLIQTTDASGGIKRNPSFFTGLDNTFQLRITEPDTDVHGLRLRVRGQFYEPLTGVPADPDGTVQGVWTSNFGLAKYTSLNVSLSSTVTTITSARVGDGTLFYTIDPSTTQTTFMLNQFSYTISHELSDRWRIRQGGGALMTTTLQAPPFPLASGLSLDRRGFDGFQPFGTLAVLHDFTSRDTGDIAVMYRYLYAPYSLDFTQSPPRVGGPQKMHQVIPDVGWNHQWTDNWRTITRAGVSVASPPNFDPDTRVVLRPVGTEEVYFANERWSFIGVASATYGAVTPRLGAGPQIGAVASLAGVPYSYGKWGRMVMIYRAQASYASINAGPNTSATLTVVGASAEARYPLTKWLGLMGGYDVRFSTFATSGGPVTPYFRNILFLGLSGYWTTDGTIPPLQLLEAPFKPG
ncbi:MAG: hypothetical protein JWM74_4781 [Myxococcaceae bacterium]|nr:hypothetical protein [Myxococcaceae bacterium]